MRRQRPTVAAKTIFLRVQRKTWHATLIALGKHASSGLPDVSRTAIPRHRQHLRAVHAERSYHQEGSDGTRRQMKGVADFFNPHPSRTFVLRCIRCIWHRIAALGALQPIRDIPADRVPAHDSRHRSLCMAPSPPDNAATPVARGEHHADCRGPVPMIGIAENAMRDLICTLQDRFAGADTSAFNPPCVG